MTAEETNGFPFLWSYMETFRLSTHSFVSFTNFVSFTPLQGGRMVSFKTLEAPHGILCIP